MSKLSELRDFVKQQFEQANTDDKDKIDMLAKINNSLDDVEKEQDDIEAKNAELVKSYKDLVKHTSFNDISKMPTDQVGKSNDVEARLDAALQNAIKEFKKN